MPPWVASGALPPDSACAYSKVSLSPLALALQSGAPGMATLSVPGWVCLREWGRGWTLKEGDSCRSHEEAPAVSPSDARRPVQKEILGSPPFPLRAGGSCAGREGWEAVEEGGHPSFTKASGGAKGAAGFLLHGSPSPGDLSSSGATSL